ncbi:hypothetical protein Adt_35132 [Abeliophyllum distichum]|uniref:Uncharacterized protein n=1 Tax=Abeliophyllum distichum TaxID=126358 RepID=A0ABD1QDU4_9LAMI
MKIVKEDGQWVAKTKGSDVESGPSTLPFEGNEKMEEVDDEEDAPPHLILVIYQAHICHYPPPPTSPSPRTITISLMARSTLLPPRLKACNLCFNNSGQVTLLLSLRCAWRWLDVGQLPFQRHRLKLSFLQDVFDESP